MSARRLACVLTLCALSGAPRAAGAQQPGAPAATPASDAVKRAEALYKEGARLYIERKWAEAEAAFQKAWALNPTFDVAYNLANTEYRLGKYRDAAEHYAFALHTWPLLASTSGLRGTAEKRLAESKALVGALTVKVNVTKAEVLVDGKVVGTAPLPLEVYVEPGARTVEAKLAGYASAKETLAIEKGAARTVELTLVAAPVKAADASGAKVGAGAEMGLGPKAGGAEDPRGEGGPNKGVIIAGIASSAVAITGGIVFAIASSVKAGEAEDLRTSLVQRGGPPTCLSSSPHADCVAIEDTIGAQETFLNLSVWSFVAGGVLGAGTAVYALATPKPKPASSMRVVPVASARAAGLVLVGAW